MSKRKKRLIIILSAVVVVLLVAMVFVGNFFYDFSLKSRRGERAPGVQTDDVAGTSEEASAWTERAWFDDNAQTHFITSGDGLQLAGHLVETEGNRYAIVVHGYTGNGRSMSGFGEQFYDRGFSVLMPDCRGHGESEGDYIGMGWPDRLDIIAWIDWIIERNPQAEILLYGISMGGATVMMTSGEDLPPQVKAVIEDCGYTSVWDEFRTQLREQFGLPAFPVLHIASVTARVRAGYWLQDADAVKQVAKSTLPMLFIHGEDDTFVPFWMLEPLYEAKPEPKEKLVVPGAVHGASASVAPELYWETIDTFLATYM